jgi:hypothetical protein
VQQQIASLQYQYNSVQQRLTGGPLHAPELLQHFAQLQQQQAQQQLAQQAQCDQRAQLLLQQQGQLLLNSALMTSLAGAREDAACHGVVTVTSTT